jgi:flavodoxin
MKLLIVYATNSGSTKEVAELITQDCISAGHAVTLISAEYTSSDDLKGYDCVLLGSCTWEMITPVKRFEGQLQQHMAKLRDSLKGKDMSGQRFAIFALGDSSYTNFCIAANHLEALVKQLKGEQIGSTLRIDSYFFDQSKRRKEAFDWTQKLLRLLAH